MKDFLANQDSLDDQALQVKLRNAVMMSRVDYLVLRVSKVHQGFQVSQEEMVSRELQDRQALKAWQEMGVIMDGLDCQDFKV